MVIENIFLSRISVWMDDMVTGNIFFLAPGNVDMVTGNIFLGRIFVWMDDVDNVNDLIHCRNDGLDLICNT